MDDSRHSDPSATDLEALRSRVVLLEALLEGALEASDGLAWAKDLEGRFLCVNREFASLAASTVAKMRGQTDLDTWPLEQAEAFRRDDAEVIRLGTPKSVKEPLDEQREGRTVWLSTRKVPVVGPEGEILGTAGTARDITEQHWASIERDRAQSDLVDVQGRRAEALAIPVLRLWTGVLVIPLSGSIDAWRAARLMDVLLVAIQREAAREVLIDITGVREVDGEIADRLLKAVRAAHFVGARSSLVNHRADIAAAIVTLCGDAEDVPIYATLEGALADIMRRTGTSPEFAER